MTMMMMIIIIIIIIIITVSHCHILLSAMGLPAIKILIALIVNVYIFSHF
jgi:hypothetical protein